ncbi:hypothetical protein Pcinc_039798 [Petrolisthes cinctipes]|uniref:Uncharacterized protein n=1 Tax=Petrolisthes cinctipes TaxID=88211 RepID=A0AAE1BNF1_PETCI|nr:hypothetical protein Pcinc_039798 [Petrolisthes cinctipes]
MWRDTARYYRLIFLTSGSQRSSGGDQDTTELRPEYDGGTGGEVSWPWCSLRHQETKCDQWQLQAHQVNPLEWRIQHRGGGANHRSRTHTQTLVLSKKRRGEGAC